MTNSIPVYQTDSALQPAAADESQFGEHLFLADPLRGLEDSAKVTGRLLAVLEQDPRPEFADAIRINRDHFHQTTVMLERRYARIERLETDPLMMADLRDQALALIIELPISQYLASVRPGILLWRDGNTYHGPCPCIGHDFDDDSFRIFNDDYAWCRTCGGGTLFRIIGMVEALSSPYEQVIRAAELAGIELPTVGESHAQSRSLPTPFFGEKRRKDHTGRGSVFQPIRIVNGRVSP